MIEPIAAVALDAGIKSAISKTTASLIDKLSVKFAKDKFDIVKFDIDKGLPEYLEANYAKCNTLKTLLNRNDPVELDDCFVAPDFKLTGTVNTSDNLLGHVNQSGGKVVISGLAGSGKSVFLKYSFRYVIENGHSYYPIFFELRALNGLSVKKNKDFLLSAIYSSIHSCCDSFTRAQFNHGLKSGAFYFLLDGFDELKQEIREQVSSDITRLSRNHNKCAILVTSRPSDEFVSWEGFSEARLLPFDLKKAVEYISKLRFDEERKKEFLADLKEGLFETNKDFLSNPLLSAMMLLTYDSFGEIPEKRHIFYSKCFDVLAKEHDASKGRYKRELFSNLTMEVLEKVFMFFCALSFSEQLFSFSEEEMKKYVDRAISACGHDAEILAVIRDFRESISIMELVGLHYEFAHRSFQEYFYAKFAVTDRVLPLKKKVDWLFDEFMATDTIGMIADMDSVYFEDEFLLPYLKSLDIKFSKVDPNTNPAGVLSKFFSQFEAIGTETDNGNGTNLAITYNKSAHRNNRLLRHAISKYRDEVSLELSRSIDGFTKDFDEFNKLAAILNDEFGGGIKIHHANNRKLKRIKGEISAARIKGDISVLRRHLETKQAKRKSGLSALILGKYT